MAPSLSREEYLNLYGPTAGDRIRLADTGLWAEVERDDNPYGDELLAGQGKTDREWLMSSSSISRDEAMDLIITNVVAMDPVLGIFKTNIGIKEGRIAGLGRAGNPEVVDGPSLLLDAQTGIIPGEGLIATAGAVDTHVHFIQPALLPEALSSGVTTLIGMGAGVFDMGTNPRFLLHRMLEATEGVPLNLGFLGRCSSMRTAPLVEMLEGGACGLKIHEDKGAYPEIIGTALEVADAMDVQVAIHTDGLNETGCLTETLATIGGRTIHAYHVDGAGGGHVPDTLALVGKAGILASSTTPTIPVTINTEAEHFDMIRTVHRMKGVFGEDSALARARIRPSTMAAENLLHDLGAIPMTNSDSQGMGRIGETVRRTWQLAHRMKEVQKTANDRHDNARILRYLAKYTLNPAIAHGLAHEVGSLEPGKLADIVLWQPRFFGVRPETVLKGGMPAWASLAEGNASIRSAQPYVYRPHWGVGGAAASLSVLFLAGAALQRPLPTGRRRVAVKDTRRLSQDSMVRNNARPQVTVDPSSYEVRIDGELATLSAAERVVLNRLYLLS